MEMTIAVMPKNKIKHNKLNNNNNKRSDIAHGYYICMFYTQFFLI